MKQNKYDDAAFFAAYSKMPRSTEGLKAAGEWHALRELLPPLAGKRVLDLGCGFGWHCRYAAEQGAESVVGVDLSEKMLDRAKKTTDDPRITYMRAAMEDADFEPESFDVVLSSLMLHYVQSFEAAAEKVYRFLRPGGSFVFSAEHPIFTAYGNQDFYRGSAGEKLHWPVDRYFSEGARDAVFLGQPVVKYHKTLTTYINTLLRLRFRLTGLVEPMPDEEMLSSVPEMAEELRRPMMLLVSAVKE